MCAHPLWPQAQVLEGTAAAEPTTNRKVITRFIGHLFTPWQLQLDFTRNVARELYTMDDVVAHVQEHWSAEGAEVSAQGRSSLTVSMPYEFRALNEAMSGITLAFDVNCDLRLTADGAELNIQKIGSKQDRRRGGEAANTEVAALQHGVRGRSIPWVYIALAAVVVIALLAGFGLKRAEPSE